MSDGLEFVVLRPQTHVQFEGRVRRKQGFGLLRRRLDLALGNQRVSAGQKALHELFVALPVLCILRVMNNCAKMLVLFDKLLRVL
jgi:hypothetical protein